MLHLIQLATALRKVFETGIEFKPESFVELSSEKLDAYRRKVGPVTTTLYEVVVFEPTVIERVGNEKITLEISIVTEAERDLMLKAVQFVHRTTAEMKGKKISFQDRLDWLRPKLPGVIVGDDPL